MIRFWRLLGSRTPPIPGADGRPKAGSIASLETLRLGGIDQTVLLRGHDVRKPVLLFLHGGPGSSLIPLAPLFSRELEQHFVVVHWDQRGAGKSYSPRVPRESMTTDRFIEDCAELAQHLRQRFDGRRAIVVGHSWGTELGVLTVQRHPQLFQAYVAVAQVVDKQRAERISLEFALQGARQAGHVQAVQRLERLNPPAYDGSVEDLLFQRSCVMRYGGTLFDPAQDKRFFRMYFESHEYSLGDLRRLKAGSAFTLGAMWSDRLQLNLIQTARHLEVPVLFIHGRCDRVTPTELAQEYFDVLQAPSKELVWFERSGHCPLFEEPERFQQLLIGRFGERGAGTTTQEAACA